MWSNSADYPENKLAHEPSSPGHRHAAASAFQNITKLHGKPTATMSFLGASLHSKIIGMEKYNTEISWESITNNTNMRPLNFLLIISCSAPRSFLCHQILPVAVIQRQLCLKKATGKMGLILARAWCPKNHVIISKTKWQQTKRNMIEAIFSKGTVLARTRILTFRDMNISPELERPRCTFSEWQSNGSQRTNTWKKNRHFSK